MSCVSTQERHTANNKNVYTWNCCWRLSGKKREKYRSTTKPIQVWVMTRIEYFFFIPRLSSLPGLSNLEINNLFPKKKTLTKPQRVSPGWWRDLLIRFLFHTSSQFFYVCCCFFPTFSRCWIFIIRARLEQEEEMVQAAAARIAEESNSISISKLIS